MLDIVRNDITKVSADALVNTANPKPVYGSGTDYAVYKAAGEEELLAARREIGDIAPGEIAVTPAFNLKAKYLIHTVGPLWTGGESGEFDCLASCYRKSLEKAKELGCGSIAFPLISTGVYGFPKDRALKIAVDTVSSFLDENEMDVTLVVFDRASFRLSEELSADVDRYLRDNFRVREYIDDSYVQYAEQENYTGRRLNLPDAFRLDSDEEADFNCPMSEIHAKPEKVKKKAAGRKASALKQDTEAPEETLCAQAAPQGIDDYIGKLGESFSTCLMRMIDDRGLSDAQVYKKANIDRRLFSKIRCTPGYRPQKKTALAFAVSLELNLDETLDLLGKAGFTLSPSSKFDLIVEYCITHGIYNINDINTILFDYNQELLAG